MTSDSKNGRGQPGTLEAELEDRVRHARAGGRPKYHDQLEAKGKQFVRDRLGLLLDEGSFVENRLLARTMDDGLAADAIVTGLGRIDGRPVCVIANDSTVKAGAWGRETIRKITRQQDEAERAQCPLVYLVDSAGARLNEQFDIFIDRNHAGRIFYNQARLSGQVPQICVLFGPSPAGAAYIPAFSDAVIMVEGNASASLASPRMVEMAIGEITTEEEMAGARMHCEVSGLGDYLAVDEDDALDAVRDYLSYLPQSWSHSPTVEPARPPVDGKPVRELIPEAENRAFDVRKVIARVFDEGSVFEHKALYARELVCAFARLEGHAVGVLANQPMQKAGTVQVGSSDKGTQFVELCDAYGLPLVFLADTPGFMVGSVVEREGIIRHGAKFLAAIANAHVPRICVVMRKAYGAGYFAMSGAGFQPDAMIALATAKLAIMGPEAAVNAVHYNTIHSFDEPEERKAYVAARRSEYMENLDVFRAASHSYVDTVISADDLRGELVSRLAHYRGKRRDRVPRWHGVTRG